MKGTTRGRVAAIPNLSESYRSVSSSLRGTDVSVIRERLYGTRLMFPSILPWKAREQSVLRFSVPNTLSAQNTHANTDKQVQKEVLPAARTGSLCKGT